MFNTLHRANLLNIHSRSISSMINKVNSLFLLFQISNLYTFFLILLRPIN